LEADLADQKQRLDIQTEDMMAQQISDATLNMHLQGAEKKADEYR